MSFKSTHRDSGSSTGCKRRKGVPTLILAFCSGRLSQRIPWDEEEAALGQAMVEKDQAVASLSNRTGPAGYPGAESGW